MEMFSEIKTSTIREIIVAINQYMATNSPIKRTDLIKRICKTDMITPAEENMIDQIFTTDSKNTSFIKPKLNVSIPILPTSIELQWLTDLLNSQKANLLLTPTLKDKLLSQLAPYKTDSNIWEQLGWNYAPIPQHKYYSDPSYIEIFKLCHKSLQTNKKIYYESHDEFGNNYSGIASPFKIEYCVTTNSFNFIMWNDERKWTFKSDIATITKIDILKESIDENVVSKAQEYVESLRANAEPIRLRIQPKNNALVRCFLLLAAYEKDLTQVENDDSFIIDIYHRTHFDEEDILQTVLSLGSAVTVISPPKFREKTIDLIAQSFTR